MHVGRGNLLQLAGQLAAGHRDLALGRLGIRRKSAGTAEQIAFTRIGQGHKLDGLVAADLARVGVHHAPVQSHALAHARVGHLHLLVGGIQTLGVSVEAVGVFHDELARAKQPETRTHLVAELHLHLPQRDGQVLVAAQLVAYEVGDQLLVRGA